MTDSQQEVAYMADEPEVINDREMDGSARTDGGAPDDLSRQPANDALDRAAGEHPAESNPAPVAPVAVATVEALSFGYMTTRRMRVNVTKNSKGYSYERTVEITTDDPDIELSQVVSEELRLADNTARDEIEQCEYIDANGRPGADDDVPLTRPF